MKYFEFGQEHPEIMVHFMEAGVLRRDDPDCQGSGKSIMLF